MPIFATVAGWLTKSTTGAVKDVTGTVRDVQELRKARIETELKQRELDSKNAVINPATFEDVKQFDPKYNEIKRKFQIKPQPYDVPGDVSATGRWSWGLGLLWILLFLGLVWVFLALLHLLFR